MVNAYKQIGADRELAAKFPGLRTQDQRYTKLMDTMLTQDALMQAKVPLIISYLSGISAPTRQMRTDHGQALKDLPFDHLFAAKHAFTLINQAIRGCNVECMAVVQMKTEAYNQVIRDMAAKDKTNEMAVQRVNADMTGVEQGSDTSGDSFILLANNISSSKPFEMLTAQFFTAINSIVLNPALAMTAARIEEKRLQQSIRPETSVQREVFQAPASDVQLLTQTQTQTQRPKGKPKSKPTQRNQERKEQELKANTNTNTNALVTQRSNLNSMLFNAYPMASDLDF